MRKVSWPWQRSSDRSRHGAERQHAKHGKGTQKLGRFGAEPFDGDEPHKA